MGVASVNRNIPVIKRNDFDFCEICIPDWYFCHDNVMVFNFLAVHFKLGPDIFLAPALEYGIVVDLGLARTTLIHHFYDAQCPY